MIETAKDITDHFIQRAKNLQEYIVETDVPENFRFNGVIPFDLEIKENVLYAKVWAVEFDEAAKKLDEWLETCK
jgi:hypothetical protein